MPTVYSSTSQRSRRNDYDVTRRPRQAVTTVQHEAPRGSASAAQTFALVHLGARNPRNESDRLSDRHTHSHILSEATSRRERESSQNTRTSSQSSRRNERGNRVFEKPTTFQIEYSGISTEAESCQMNGSIGEAQLGKWSNIHAARHAGPQLNGGIRNTNKHDVEAAAVVFKDKKTHNTEAHSEREAGCCIVM